MVTKKEYLQASIGALKHVVDSMQSFNEEKLSEERYLLLITPYIRMVNKLIKEINEIQLNGGEKQV